MLKDKDIQFNMVVYLTLHEVHCPVYITKISYCVTCRQNHYYVRRVFGKIKQVYVSNVIYFDKVNTIIK
jgi:hypothetical protein